MSKQLATNLQLRQRNLVRAAVLLSLVSVTSLMRPADAARLVTEEQAQRLGLTREWFAQTRLDPARNHVERAILEGDRITVLTTAGVVHEFDALTGETKWIASAGNPDYPSLGPAADDKHVALVNGSTLYVLDRVDGKPIKVRQVGGAPGAAPGLSASYVFVPLVSGRVEAYPLDKAIFTPWFYQSMGRAMVAPLVTPESLVWTTDSGHMYVGRANELGMRFRLETGSEIIAPPAYHKPFVFTGTMSGEVFAMNELTGLRLWKYATGFPVLSAPAAVGNRVFVTSEEPALHCIDAETGLDQWIVPGIKHFAAVSATRVYGVDDLGRIVVLDAKTGGLIGHMKTNIGTRALVNDQTDRIYLVSADGLVQCLHEVGAEQPLYHVPKEPATTPATEPGAETPPATSAQPADEADEADEEPAEEEPAETEAPPVLDEEDPFNL